MDAASPVSPATTLLPGTEVVARNLRWEVVSVEPSGDQRLVRLRGREGLLRGQEVDLLTPFEDIVPVASALDPKRPSMLPEWWLYHRAFLLEQAFGPSALLAAQPGRLRIQPYQLVPVMRALSMGRARLLLADGVGLGKTIEAGLVLAELIARRRAHRILIVSPAGPLQDQWRREMSVRFGLRFRVLDRDVLQEIRYETEVGANPFDHEALALISMDFAKQEWVLQDLERTQFDVVVIDEAHHCYRLGEEGDREDSQRRLLAEVLARQADSLLLLTATPHDGYDSHFASLVELLDPSLVDGRCALRGDAYRGQVVRRLKRHVKDPVTGRELFPERSVTPVRVAVDSARHRDYAALHRDLLALVVPQLRRAQREKRYSEVLSFFSLLKRSVSTAAACRETLGAVRQRLETIAERADEEQAVRHERLRSLRALNRRIERFGLLSIDEEAQRSALEAEQIAADLAASRAEAGAAARDVRREGARIERVRDSIDALRELELTAERATAADPKLHALLGAVLQIRREEPGANVLVYTEYTDSQAAARSLLEQARQRGELKGKILVISGEDSDKVRTAQFDRFTSEDGLVLISTDATAEGLNLHARCHHLLHLELPYNPNRLEQRNGRIDRFGQTLEPKVGYLYLAGTFEERLLLRLVAKYERQRARLTFVPNTLGLRAADSASASRLLEGLTAEQGKLFEDTGRLDFASGEDEDTSSPEYRDLLDEVDRALRGFEKAALSHAWLGELGSWAEARSLTDAAQARDEGLQLGAGDLMGFVRDAVVSETGDAGHTDASATLHLPLTTDWTYGLEELPGFDAETHVLRLTSSLDTFRDERDQPVGYLGRAHPIVRRALERVRHASAAGGGTGLDRRVSAARSDGTDPEALLTFLGRVSSAAGPEVERVVAVRLGTTSEPLVYSRPADWGAFGAPDRAVPVRDVYVRHFKAWLPERLEAARMTASAAFAEIAREGVARLRLAVADERRELGAWLRVRAEELCGRVPAAEQLSLLDDSRPATRPAFDDDSARLAALVADPGTPRAKRREATGVLELWRRRLAELDRRESLSEPEITTLGLLMLVPAEEGRRVTRPR